MYILIACLVIGLVFTLIVNASLSTKFETRISSLTEENSNLSSKIESLEADNEELSSKNDTLSASLQDITKRNEELEANLSKAEGENRQLQANVKNLEAKNTNQTSSIEKMQKQFEIIQTAIPVQVRAVLIAKNDPQPAPIDFRSFATESTLKEVLPTNILYTAYPIKWVELTFPVSEGIRNIGYANTMYQLDENGHVTIPTADASGNGADVVDGAFTIYYEEPDKQPATLQLKIVKQLQGLT